MFQDQDYTQNGIELPNRIFLTGVPGSRWSGIAQTIESLNGFNTSDRSAERQFSHNQFSGHKGAYFGSEMEFDSKLEANYIDNAWTSSSGCKLVKSHDWAYKLDSVKSQFPNDWIMLVYRPDTASCKWWHEAGGFDIKYPNYSWYKNSSNMLAEIELQNNEILNFAYKYNLVWSYFTPNWIKQNFKQHAEVKHTWPDVLVTLLK